MKRILLVTSLCLLASFSFAQKKAVKDAKSAMKNNVPEARELIKPALTNPETASDPETWKIAGDIEYKAFDDERTLEMQKEITGKGGNEEAMYVGLYNMYDPYIKADELGQVPNEKGQVKNKFRKDIVKNMRDGHRFYINGGVFYNDKKDFKKAADFFERYWELPTLAMFEDTQADFNLQDTTYQTIKYYAVISSIQSQDHPRSIKLLKKLISEPYIQNSTYKESDVYELLTSEYQQIDDSVAYVNALLEGAQKFPKNKYFTPNLINEYIRGGKTTEAIAYLDQAIVNDPTNTCDLMSVKASLYSEQKDYAQAEPAYQTALNADANCERALEGLGVLYVLQAQDMKEKAGQSTNRKEQADMDKQTTELYSKALPYLEKYRDILKSKNAESLDLRPALMKLQNVYYNLSLLNVDKSKELEAIDKELSALN
ncbi:MAG: tetratricopeptide repeat protein [Prevotella sp.]|jgi:tetratricopeptide (TPR) repeat protein|uniref:tetratricopeptide repeat protein n=1 Tax=unclassified Dysgonomonas TaxID=2630389 RepID=UPI0025C594AC|nr:MULTISPECIES: tetratricopeptide repeat protein [unclassified Dysgonomonas]MDR1714420.1 tetratricopeptide repeat protein [Prevotella sp.]MDR2002974.1 tetratricopeptide repeat protein [Prevotella sp.]HMM03908.1 tetratricopeptide repeat protein [Dysgonomonas sp.]